MTVAELIARLSELDGTLEIITDGCGGCHHDVTSVVTDDRNYPDAAVIRTGY